MMIKPLFLALFLSFFAIEGLAAADGDDHSACKGEEGWLPRNMIIDGLSKKGFTVKQIRQEHDCLEVDAVDKKGKNWELLVHPSSGKVLSAEGV